MTKRCAGCGIEKDESQFWRLSASSDGLDYYCHECRKAASRKHQENQELLCTNCGERKQYAKGLCERCYSYHRRNGRDSPKIGLTDDEAIEAVADFLSGNLSLKKIAERYKISLVTLKSIFLGENRRYAHLQARIPNDKVHALMNWKSRKHGAKFVPSQILKIRRLRAEGATLDELGKQFRVNPATISLIVRGKTYADIRGERTMTRPKTSASRLDRLNRNAERVLLALMREPHASLVELQRWLGISRGCVVYNIKKLVRLGMIKRERYKHRFTIITEKGRKEIGSIRAR